MKLKPFIPRWLNEAGLSQADFRVNCCLLSRADTTTGIAFPHAETIASDCCMARNTVWKSLRSLEEKGFIRRLGKPFKGSNRYQILMPPIGANETPIETPTSANETPIDTAPIGANQILQSAQMDSRQSAQMDSRECNPRNVIQGMLSIEKRTDCGSMPFDSENFREAWLDWQQHRKEIKKPLTPKSSEQQLRNFAEWGETRSIAAIRYTIGNGWQGIREPEAARNSSTSPRGRDIPLDLGGRKPSAIRGIPQVPASNDSSLPDFGQPTFREVVALYPKRHRVCEAEAALEAHVRNGTDLEAVVAGTRAIAAIIQRMPGGEGNVYVPSALTFFQNRRWEDDPKTWLRNAGQNGAPVEELYQGGGRKGTVIELKCP